MIFLPVPHVGTRQAAFVPRIHPRLAAENDPVFGSEDGQKVVVVLVEETALSKGVLALIVLSLNSSLSSSSVPDSHLDAPV